jgi:hypothetical protein
MAALAFAATSPYILLDWSHFWDNFASMAHEHMLSNGHASGDPAWLYWVRHNFRYGLGWVGLLALVASLMWNGGGWRREEEVVLCGAVVFVALLFGASSVFMRYAQPLAPLLAVLMVRSALALVRWRVAFAIWVALLLAEPLYASLQQRALLAGEDTRELARDWLAARSSAGQRMIQIPKGAGQVPLLKSEQVFVRMDPFIASYGSDGLERAFEVLAYGPELPGLYVNWTPVNYAKAELPEKADGPRPSPGGGYRSDDGGAALRPHWSKSRCQVRAWR